MPPQRTHGAKRQLTRTRVGPLFFAVALAAVVCVRMAGAQTNVLPLYTFTNAHTQGITNLNYISETNQVVTASSDFNIKLWEYSTQGSSALRTFTGHTGYVRKSIAAKYVSAGNTISILISCGDDQKILYWDLSSASLLQTITELAPVLDLLVVQSDDTLAAALNECTACSSLQRYPISIYGLQNRTLVRRLGGHTQEPRSLCYVTDSILASASSDATVKLWRYRTGVLVQSMQGPGYFPLNFVISIPSTNYVLAGNSQGQVLVFDLKQDYPLVNTLSAHSTSSTVQSITYLWGTLIASSATDRLTRVYDYMQPSTQSAATITFNLTGVSTNTFVSSVVYAPSANRLLVASSTTLFVYFLQVCAPGYYQQTAGSSQCLLCAYRCATCSGTATQCTQCASNRLVTPQCYCPTAGFYDDGVTAQCQSCDGKCASCTGSALACDTCSNGRINPPQCACPSGTYDVGTPACAPCHANCNSCFGPGNTQCITCKSGFYKQSGSTCLSTCPQGQYFSSADQACYVQCPLGQFGQSGLLLCAACANVCTHCFGGTDQQCYACVSGYVLQGTACQTQCDGGYAPSLYGICVPCATNCKLCVQAVNGACVQCADGFFMTAQGRCSACHATCATCTGASANQCLTCSATLYRTLNAQSNTCACALSRVDDGNAFCDVDTDFKLEDCPIYLYDPVTGLNCTIPNDDGGSGDGDGSGTDDPGVTLTSNGSASASGDTVCMSKKSNTLIKVFWPISLVTTAAICYAAHYFLYVNKGALKIFSSAQHDNTDTLPNNGGDPESVMHKQGPSANSANRRRTRAPVRQPTSEEDSSSVIATTRKMLNKQQQHQQQHSAQQQHHHHHNMSEKQHRNVLTEKRRSRPVNDESAYDEVSGSVTHSRIGNNTARAIESPSRLGDARPHSRQNKDQSVRSNASPAKASPPKQVQHQHQQQQVQHQQQQQHVQQQSSHILHQEELKKQEISEIIRNIDASLNIKPQTPIGPKLKDAMIQPRGHVQTATETIYNESVAHLTSQQSQTPQYGEAPQYEEHDATETYPQTPVPLPQHSLPPNNSNSQTQQFDDTRVTRQVTYSRNANQSQSRIHDSYLRQIEDIVNDRVEMSKEYLKRQAERPKLAISMQRPGAMPMQARLHRMNTVTRQGQKMINEEDIDFSDDG